MRVYIRNFIIKLIKISLKELILVNFTNKFIERSLKKFKSFFKLKWLVS